MKCYILLVAVLISGCATVSPQQLTPVEIKSVAAQDRTLASAGVDDVRGPLRLDEAIARALKYNLERRTRIMEEALAIRQFDVGAYDMLPRLVAGAGYSQRSQYLTTSSIDSVTGAPSLAHPFISSDREHWTADLGLTWSLLDFGLSYYNAKQNADRILIAAERRRKALHLLVQDVRTAFWRAASAQKLRDDLRRTIALADEALADSRTAERERIRAPLDSLRYQRQLLENVRLLESIEQDLGTARVELAHLVNAPLGRELVVEEADEGLNRRLLDTPVKEMEETAILRNADLRDQFYSAKVARDESRKILLRLFPGLSFNLDLRHDSDRFLVHQNWSDAGAQLSFSLVNLLSMPAQKKLAEAGVALADQRRMTTQMVVLAQLHVARLQYASAYQQFLRADAIYQVDERMNRIIAAGERAQSQSKLDRVSSDTTTILSLLRRYQALALVHAAASKLQATMGLEPEVPSVSSSSLQELTGVAAEFLRQTQGDAAAVAPKAP